MYHVLRWGPRFNAHITAEGSGFKVPGLSIRATMKLELI